MTNWAVFLDRDGTLNEDAGLVTSPEQLVLIPGVADALKRLRDAGAKLLLITNQPVIARELITEDELAAIHAALPLAPRHRNQYEHAHRCDGSLVHKCVLSILIVAIETFESCRAESELGHQR